MLNLPEKTTNSPTKHPRRQHNQGCSETDGLTEAAAPNATELFISGRSESRALFAGV